MQTLIPNQFGNVQCVDSSSHRQQQQIDSSDMTMHGNLTSYVCFGFVHRNYAGASQIRCRRIQHKHIHPIGNPWTDVVHTREESDNDYIFAFGVKRVRIHVCSKSVLQARQIYQHKNTRKNIGQETLICAPRVCLVPSAFHARRHRRRIVAEVFMQKELYAFIFMLNGTMYMLNENTYHSNSETVGHRYECKQMCRFILVLIRLQMLLHMNENNVDRLL